MTDTRKDQDEFVDQMVYIATTWLRPMPPGIDKDLTSRLDGFVFSLFPELEGAGGLPPYRLSPKDQPGINLVDHGLRDTWPDVDDTNVEVRTFLTGVRNALRLAQEAATAVDVDPGDVMLLLAYSIFLLVEDGYELRPQFFTDDFFVGEGDNIAPDLAAAFRAHWNQT